MSLQNPLLAPAKPTEISLETLPQLFAHNRARFGGWTMTAGVVEPGDGQQQQQAQGQQQQANQPPERPDGISEAEWNALGDPGRSAIVREREARQAAERALAASRAKPAPPKNQGGDGQQQQAGGQQGQQGQQQNQGGNQGGDAPDIAKLIQEAVTAAVKPFQERDEQREAEAAARKVTDAVMAAAANTFHDATDALTGIDLAAVTDGNGKADPTKIQAAFDDLLKRKPHLGKVPDGRRYAGHPGAGANGGSTKPLDERVKDTLARMQASAGIKQDS